MTMKLFINIIVLFLGQSNVLILLTRCIIGEKSCVDARFYVRSGGGETFCRRGIWGQVKVLKISKHRIYLVLIEQVEIHG